MRRSRVIRAESALQRVAVELMIAVLKLHIWHVVNAHCQSIMSPPDETFFPPSFIYMSPPRFRTFCLSMQNQLVLALFVQPVSLSTWNVHFDFEVRGRDDGLSTLQNKANRAFDNNNWQVIRLQQF